MLVLSQVARTPGARKRHLEFWRPWEELGLGRKTPQHHLLVKSSSGAVLPGPALFATHFLLSISRKKVYINEGSNPVRLTGVT